MRRCTRCEYNDNALGNGEAIQTGPAMVGQLLHRLTHSYELYGRLQLNHGSTCILVQSIGYTKVFAKCVPRMLSVFVKEESMVANEIFMKPHNTNTICTGYQPWIHSYEPQNKICIEWRYTQERGLRHDALQRISMSLRVGTDGFCAPGKNIISDS